MSSQTPNSGRCFTARGLTALCCALLSCVLLSTAAFAQAITNNKYRQADKFRQLEELLPTPNDYRTASGAPGHRYWQQKVDYQIDVELDDATQRIIGREVITYTNNSPDTLNYLWLQLDANIKHPESGRALAAPAPWGYPPRRSADPISHPWAP